MSSCSVNSIQSLVAAGPGAITPEQFCYGQTVICGLLWFCVDTSNHHKKLACLRTCTYRSIQVPLATNTKLSQSLLGPGGKPLNCHHRDAESSLHPLAEGKGNGRGHGHGGHPHGPAPSWRGRSGPARLPPRPALPAPRRYPRGTAGTGRSAPPPSAPAPGALGNTQPPPAAAASAALPPPSRGRGRCRATQPRSARPFLRSPAAPARDSGTSGRSALASRSRGSAPSDPPGNTPGWEQRWFSLARFGSIWFRSAAPWSRFPQSLVTAFPVRIPDHALLRFKSLRATKLCEIMALKEGQAVVWEMSGEDDAAKRPQ